MAVLTTPNTPLVVTTNTNTNLLALLSPALTHSLYLASIFQRLLSTTTIFVLFRAYIISLLLLKQTFYASQILLLQTLYASRILLVQSFYASQILLVQSYYASAILAREVFVAGKMGWKAAEPLRKKLFFELIDFCLGGGNGVILLVFWPGWIVLGGGSWGVWWVCG